MTAKINLFFISIILFIPFCLFSQIKSNNDIIEKELQKIRAGKASPIMLDGVKVEYYGNMVDISQVANINTPDPKTILIQPWEKKNIQVIEKAIFAANLGLTPINDGNMIRISLPPLTEERRKEMVKSVKTEAENIRVAIRNIRRDINE